MPKNVGDLGKSIAAKGFEKLPKVQKIAQSGHTARETNKEGTVINKRGHSVHFSIAAFSEPKYFYDSLSLSHYYL